MPVWRETNLLGAIWSSLYVSFNDKTRASLAGNIGIDNVLVDEHL
jgi:hypothetical protein